MAHAGGRPRKFNTPEEMQDIIDAYFEDRKPEPVKDDDGNVLLDKKGNQVWKINPPSLSGLALALGFVDRQSIYDYEKNKKFSCTMKRARLRCENWAEEAGLSGEAPSSMIIFVLKNYGWRDDKSLQLDGKLDSRIEHIITFTENEN